MGGGGPIGPKAWRERNVNDLTDASNSDEISGFPVYKALLCQVTLVEARSNGDESGTHGASDDRCRVPTPRVRSKRQVEPAARVYLDNNATTRVDRAVIDAMLPYFEENYGNPSSMHTFGGQVNRRVEDAREKVAALLGAQPDEIIFTGCGSESDNLALRGALHTARRAGRGAQSVDGDEDDVRLSRYVRREAHEAGVGAVVREQTVAYAAAIHAVDTEDIAAAVAGDAAAVHLEHGRAAARPEIRAGPRDTPSATQHPSPSQVPHGNPEPPGV